jgi:4-amino-4-deoxy-L-arabinose transferase-like glycosyltransferase
MFSGSVTKEEDEQMPAAAPRERGPRLAPRNLIAPAVTAIALAGVAVRLLVLQESMLADELSSYWIVSGNDLSGVVSTVKSDAEITPPLFFVLSWLATQIELTPEMSRLPSLLAGTATIPVIYLLGLRTVGRSAALAATAFVSLSPFMIYYSAEARGYALMMLLVALSTLSLLLAIDTRRASWWVAYAVCSSAAVYTHYTCVFALGAQYVWVLWSHPEARGRATLANLAAAVAFLPWLSGMRADLDSPTTKILSALTPFDLESIRVSLSHVAIGYPYSILSLRELPGLVAVGSFGLAVCVALVAVVARAWKRRIGPSDLDRRLVLMVLVALSVPLCEALLSAVSTNIFGGRNLAAAWPSFALALGALLVASGRRLRYLTVGLALACFAIGAARMLQEANQRPDYQAVADAIDADGRPGDVVVDAAVLSPGPLSPLEVALQEPRRVMRFGAPDQRERPFGVFDQVVPRSQVIGNAAAAAAGGRIFVVAVRDRPGPQPTSFPGGYRRVERRSYRGTADLLLDVWAGPDRSR